jgi:response regulator RpfG family c-di-GMP phosphodiesterase
MPKTAKRPFSSYKTSERKGRRVPKFEIFIPHHYKYDYNERQYTAIVIDDEPRGISNLQTSLHGINEMELVQTAPNAAKGKEMILKHKPDVLFLDVEMPETTDWSCCER